MKTSLLTKLMSKSAIIYNVKQYEKDSRNAREPLFIEPYQFYCIAPTVNKSVKDGDNLRQIAICPRFGAVITESVVTARREY